MRSELAALERASALPLTSFRSEHVAQQVERACRREQVDGADGLARALGRDGEARRRFRRSVAISHSSLYRDPEQFALLEEVLLPRLLAGGTRLSVWSAGCSDGAELHTLGLVLERMGALDRALLLGSDLLEENLALARAGDVSAGGAGADALGAARPRRRRPAARALAARALPQRRDLSRARGPPAAVHDPGLRLECARDPAARAQRAADRSFGASGCARPARTRTSAIA